MAALMRIWCVLLLASAALSLSPARAQEGETPAPAQPELSNRCPGLVARDVPAVTPAALRLAALSENQVRLTFIGHATFLIETPQFVRIATDYNDYVRPSVVPDIATMNRAHPTHFTDHPDPGIKFVLRGWSDDGKPAGHDLTYRDVHVRSVSTNIRDFDGGTLRNGNSIFVFEIAQLCIAHLGHLHHTLTRQQLDEIGRIDVVMVPVDGSYTLDLDGTMEVLQALKAPLMIPMHYFGSTTLNRFLDRARQYWDVEIKETPSVVVSRATLPVRPKVQVLPGASGREQTP